MSEYHAAHMLIHRHTISCFECHAFLNLMNRHTVVCFKCRRISHADTRASSLVFQTLCNSESCSFADLYANLARGDWHTRQVLANSVGMSDQDAKELMDYMFEEVHYFPILALLCIQPLQSILFRSWRSMHIFTFKHCGAQSLNHDKAHCIFHLAVRCHQLAIMQMTGACYWCGNYCDNANF